jgi:hypothetical protein
VETNNSVINDILNENENLDTDFDVLLRKMLIDGYKQIKSNGGFINNVDMIMIEDDTYINEIETYNNSYNFSNSDDVFEYLEKISNQKNNNHNEY